MRLDRYLTLVSNLQQNLLKLIAYENSEVNLKSKNKLVPIYQAMFIMALKTVISICIIIEKYNKDFNLIKKQIKNKIFIK